MVTLKRLGSIPKRTAARLPCQAVAGKCKYMYVAIVNVTNYAYNSFARSAIENYQPTNLATLFPSPYPATSHLCAGRRSAHTITSVSQTLPATPRTSVHHILTVLCQMGTARLISILSLVELTSAFMITSLVPILSLIRTNVCLISSSTTNPMLATMIGPVELMVQREISTLRKLISIHAERNAPRMKSARVMNTQKSLVNVNITG